MRSDMTSASPWSCVTNTVVMPSLRWIAAISTRISSRSLRSRLESGSSSKSTAGRMTSARKRDALALPARELERTALGEAAQLD